MQGETHDTVYDACKAIAQIGAGYTAMRRALQT